MLHFICEKEINTVRLGNAFGNILEEGDIVALTGDLGAGKTHFTAGIGAALGVKDYVTSPTFTIVNEYEGRIPLFHFDLYRIENEEELFDTGFWEYLDREGITVIEWPSVALKSLEKDKNRKERIFTVEINRRDDISPTYREINIEGDGRIEKIDGSIN